MDREDALAADPVRNLPDGEGLAYSASALGDTNTLESLNSFLVALAHAHVDAERVTCPERGDVVAEPLFLGVDEGMHMALGAGVNSLVKTCLGRSRLAIKSKPIAGSMPVKPTATATATASRCPLQRGSPCAANC